MKAVVAAFNQEKALVGAFSVIVQPVDRFAAQVVVMIIVIYMMKMFAPGEAGLGLVDGDAVGGLLGGGEGGAQPAQRALTPA